MQTMIRRAREDFKNGDYRFVAEVMNKVVFADPANLEARNLAADAFEQLGYMAESDARSVFCRPRVELFIWPQQQIPGLNLLHPQLGYVAVPQLFSIREPQRQRGTLTGASGRD
jgi:hypothetical protein